MKPPLHSGYPSVPDFDYERMNVVRITTCPCISALNFFTACSMIFWSEAQAFEYFESMDVGNSLR